MANYTQITDFSVKDSLVTGDPEKLILGSDFDAELAAIATAIASKLDSVNIATEAEAEAMISDAVLMTPLQTFNILNDNAGAAYDLQQLADPGGDRITFWDDSAGGLGWLDLGSTLSISGAFLDVSEANVDHDSLSGYVANEHINHSGVSIIAGDGLTGGGTIAASRTINAVGGVGISVTSDAINLDSSIAGLGLSYTTGVLAIDISEAVEIAGNETTTAQDGILMSDNGTWAIMPLSEAGLRTVDVTDTNKTLANGDNMTIQRVAGFTANRTITIPSGSVFINGQMIAITHGNFGSSFSLTVQGATGVELRSHLRAAAAASGAHTILPGGTALIWRVSSTVWHIAGAIA